MAYSLENIRVAVTRSEAQAQPFAERLTGLGASVKLFPTIEIEPVDPGANVLDAPPYDWLILTSRNVVEHFRGHLERHGIGVEALKGIRVAAVGVSTAQAAREWGLEIELVPDRQDAEHLLAALRETDTHLSGQRILLPHGDLARSFLTEELEKLGAHVVRVLVYRTVTPDTPAERVEALVAFRPDVVTFTSPSTAVNFCRILGPERMDLLKATACFASIGSVTTKAVEDLGLQVAIEAKTSTMAGFADAVVSWRTQKGGT